jgi:hypothetical protein
MVLKVSKVAAIVLFIVLLTVLTQVGGLIFLGTLPVFKLIGKKFNNKYSKWSLQFLSFLFIYSAFTFILVPVIAKPFGRVPLPATEAEHLRPLNFMTVFLNRNYVRVDLRDAVLRTANQMNKKFPGTSINYLDANFPFFNKFPLLPHLSHNDGKKLDISFCYLDKKSGQAVNDCPSFIGYGVCEAPKAGEVDNADACEKKGYWQYSILQKIVSQGNRMEFEFDEARTCAVVELLSRESKMEKIFIEPHLKKRMGLKSAKIKAPGCQAVRHDDHIHLQVY